MNKKRLLSLLFLGCSLSASAQLSKPQIDLPNPLLMNDGTTQVETLEQWTARRQEISQMIQQYGIGQKPDVAPEAIKARMQGDTLIVDVTVNGETLTLRSCLHYPSVGQAPYALMIGTSRLSLPKDIFESRPIATDCEIGHRSISACHIANICERLGLSTLRWNPEAERFTGANADAANALLEVKHHNGWTL